MLRVCAFRLAKAGANAPATTLLQSARFQSSSDGVGGCILPKWKKPPPKVYYGRKCRPYKVPVCSEEELKKRRKTKPCQMKPRVEEIDPECCPNPCLEAHPRFDDLHYAPSDKNRPYQQTWCEFGGLRIMERPRCCYEEYDIPLPERRKRRRPGPQTDMCALARQCPNLSPKCTKIVWPGCQTKKCEFTCKYYPPPKDCLKVCTPYPSFTECDKDLPKPLHPVECDCLKIFGYCPI